MVSKPIGLEPVLCNTINIIGERQDIEKFVPLVISNLLNTNKTYIHGTKSGENWISGSRYYLHARNQADALNYIINNKQKLQLKYSPTNTMLEKFNVVGEKELTNLEVVNLIGKLMNIKPIVEFTDFHSLRPGHDLRYALDGSKLKDFGWFPPVPLDQSLERTVKWYLQNRQWLA